MEWFVAITSLVAGASHLLRPGDWAEAYRQLHRCGRPGAFVNGALHLVPGALLVAGHPSWVWPGAVLTGLGWLLVAKAGVCFLAPAVGAAIDGAGRPFAARFRRRGGGAAGDRWLGVLLPMARGPRQLERQQRLGGE